MKIFLIISNSLASAAIIELLHSALMVRLQKILNSRCPFETIKILCINMPQRRSGRPPRNKGTQVVLIGILKSLDKEANFIIWSQIYIFFLLSKFTVMKFNKIDNPSPRRNLFQKTLSFE